jgi:hypothetical protein
MGSISKQSVSVKHNKRNTKFSIPFKKLFCALFVRFILNIWQGYRDSNPEPTVLETATLPIELYPYATILIILKILQLVNKYFILNITCYVNVNILI